MSSRLFAAIEDTIGKTFVHSVFFEVWVNVWISFFQKIRNKAVWYFLFLSKEDKTVQQSAQSVMLWYAHSKSISLRSGCMGV